MTDRGANRALVLGLLALPFGVLSPFAIWNGARSLKRIRASGGAERGATRALIGLVSGAIGFLTLIIGVAYWLISS